MSRPPSHGTRHTLELVSPTRWSSSSQVRRKRFGSCPKHLTTRTSVKSVGVCPSRVCDISHEVKGNRVHDGKSRDVVKKGPLIIWDTQFRETWVGHDTVVSVSPEPPTTYWVLLKGQTTSRTGTSQRSRGGRDHSPKYIHLLERTPSIALSGNVSAPDDFEKMNGKRTLSLREPREPTRTNSTDEGKKRKIRRPQTTLKWEPEITREDKLHKNKD